MLKLIWFLSACVNGVLVGHFLRHEDVAGAAISTVGMVVGFYLFAKKKEVL